MKAKKYLISVVLVIGVIVGGCKDSQESVKDSPIHTAAIFGNLDEIESILAENPELVNAKDDDGYTPLHLAVTILGKQEAVKLLIDKGADVNAKDNMGATPLHLTLTKLGDKEIVVLLVANDADVNARTNDGFTALHMATDSGLKDIVEFLISKGADINARDAIGGTALHHLVQEGREDDTSMIEFLLSKGADINAKDHAVGGTPLHYASMNGYINIVRFLIDKGADISCQGEGSFTALSLAELEGHKDVADLLRKRMKDLSDLLHAIGETGYGDKGVLVLTERLKKIAPEINKQLGNALKQDYTFDWYVSMMLALKTSEQQFRALDMIDRADEANKAVESLDIAWSQSDLHDILKMSFYAEDVDTVLKAIEENMSEEQQQRIIVDTVPVKELAERLLKQAEKEK